MKLSCTIRQLDLQFEVGSVEHIFILTDTGTLYFGGFQRAHSAVSGEQTSPKQHILATYCAPKIQTELLDCVLHSWIFHRESLIGNVSKNHLKIRGYEFRFREARCGGAAWR